MTIGEGTWASESHRSLSARQRSLGRLVGTNRDHLHHLYYSLATAQELAVPLSLFSSLTRVSKNLVVSGESGVGDGWGGRGSELWRSLAVPTHKSAGANLWPVRGAALIIIHSHTHEGL